MRSKALILYAICIAYFLAGFQVYQIDAPSLAAVRAADPSIRAHTDLFTLHQIGLIFMIGTVLAALLAAFRKVNLGYSLVTFILVWWTSLYFLSWAQTGHWQSIYAIANYGLTATILVLVSQMTECPSKAMRDSESTPLPLGDFRFKLDKEEESD